MMDRTDRHFRYFLRRITRCSLLYTEMITTGAVLRGDRQHLLAFHPDERPLALQLGGDRPAELAHAAEIAAEWGYDEVNLNAGCPSDRVLRGNFGVCLMARPEAVAEAVAAMRRAVDLPVTVKHRIGFDDQDRYADMHRFVTTVAEAGCDRFIVHARKAWLSGLDPKANRIVPPLRYEDVYRLKEELPHLAVEINGGITTLEQAGEHLRRTDGAMIGRAAYDDPFALAAADREVFGQAVTPPTRRQVVEKMLPYLEDQLARGVSLHHLTRHLLGLFAGRPGARAWRRHLSQNAHRPGTGPDVLHDAMRHILAEVLDETPPAGLHGVALRTGGLNREGDRMPVSDG